MDHGTIHSNRGTIGFSRDMDRAAVHADQFPIHPDLFAIRMELFATDMDRFRTDTDLFATQLGQFAIHMNCFAICIDLFETDTDRFSIQADPFAVCTDHFPIRACRKTIRITKSRHNVSTKRNKPSPAHQRRVARSTSILMRQGVFCLMTTDLKESVMRVINERNRRDDEQAFHNFCEELLSLPANLELIPKENFKADIELQPLRWMSLGIDLLKSRRVTGNVQLTDGIEGPETSSYLPYPVFHAATEIFLKGMWLCQYADCRDLTDSSYIEQDKRENYSEKLKELGHDLLAILDSVRGISEYQRTSPIARFLDLVERVVRLFYFPPYEADKKTRWADARYPKRVYDDDARNGAAESFQRYPRAKWIQKLFQQAHLDLDDLWQLRRGIASEQ